MNGSCVSGGHHDSLLRMIAEPHVVNLEWLGEPDAELGSNPGSLGHPIRMTMKLAMETRFEAASQP